MPRTIAIGDVHGCSEALTAMVAALDPKPDDTIITLGDYIDRNGKRNGKRDRSDIGNRGKQTWAVTSRWPPRPAARCPADPASGTPIPGRDAWQSVSAIPSRHTAARAGRCGVAPPTRSRCRRD